MRQNVIICCAMAKHLLCSQSLGGNWHRLGACYQEISNQFEALPLYLPLSACSPRGEETKCLSQHQQPLAGSASVGSCESDVRAKSACTGPMGVKDITKKGKNKIPELHDEMYFGQKSKSNSQQTQSASAHRSLLCNLAPVILDSDENDELQYLNYNLAIALGQSISLARSWSTQSY